MNEAKKLAELKTLLQEATDLQSVGFLLHWDQTTYMPPGGAPARSRQKALLQRLAQEKRTDPAIGRLLDELTSYAEGLPSDSDEASLIRVARREYERAIRVPPSFVAERAANSAESYAAWIQARPENDFAAVRPYLQKSLELSWRYAAFFPGYDHIADPLIDISEPGMTVAAVRPLLDELGRQLQPLVDQIGQQPPTDDSCLRQNFPTHKQLVFAREVISRFGFDLGRGRIDKTHHPYVTWFSVNDVRLTTRADEDYLGDGIFATFHECGHAVYNQGVDQSFEATPLARGASSGVHESQSRLWENLVGRSRGFWTYYYPRLQKTFPAQLGATSLDTFYKAINKVERSLVRVSADELTYNLHVMIRFGLELDLLEGRLSIDDLPEAWHAAYQERLGQRAPDDRDGVLQDVHWYSFHLGGNFQGYTLGNVLSALFYQEAIKAHPEILDEIEQGRYGTLHGWLRDNIYRHGRKFMPQELVERVTGGPMTVEPYIAYLKDKFTRLYDL